MNESEIEKEYRRFHRLDTLSKIGWILTFRWLHPAWWWRRRPKSFDEEPPLVSLAKLAEKGIQKSVKLKRLNENALKRLLSICAKVARSKGAINEIDVGLITQLLNEFGPEGLTAVAISDCTELFRHSDEDFLALKNLLYQLKGELSKDQLEETVKWLYRLAYLEGFEGRASRAVADMGVKLGLSFSEIRLIATSTRREIEKEQTTIG